MISTLNAELAKSFIHISQPTFKVWAILFSLPSLFALLLFANISLIMPNQVPEAGKCVV